VTQIAFVSDMRGQYVTALKRVRIVDPNAITYQRIPPVLPESWAKRIQPYVPTNMRLSTHAEWSHKDVLASEGSQRPAPPADLKVRLGYACVSGMSVLSVLLFGLPSPYDLRNDDVVLTAAVVLLFLAIN
jgi:hypothetical protein